MRLYTAHLKADADPQLVREGFSFGAGLLGPLWLAAHRAWLAAVICLAGFILIATLAPSPLCWILGVGSALLLALTGHDLRRWSLEHRGYLLVHVLAARGHDDAFLRLLAHRPDLAERSLQRALR